MYGELLILYNTVFNFILLAFTCEVSRFEIKKSRLFVSALVSSFIAVVFQHNWCISIVSFVVLIILAFGFNLHVLIRKGGIMWIAALFLGGCLVFIQPFIEQLSVTNFFIISMLIAICAMYMFYRHWYYEKQQRLQSTFITSTVITFYNQHIALRCYIDSGNVCTEPISGKPVHFVSCDAIMNHLPMDWQIGLQHWDANDPYNVSALPKSLAKRIRFIQLTTVQQHMSTTIAIRFDEWALTYPSKLLINEYIVLVKQNSNFPHNTEAILHVSALSP